MLIPFDKYEPFKLTSEFLAPYHRRPVSWGFGTLSWVTYKRTYSRDQEEWWQTCQRVIEGMITVQKIHCLENKRTWNPQQAHYHAQNAYDRMWQFKWTPHRLSAPPHARLRPAAI